MDRQIVYRSRLKRSSCVVRAIALLFFGFAPFTSTPADVVTIDSDLQIGPINSLPMQGVDVTDRARVEILMGGEIATSSATRSIVGGQSTLTVEGGFLGGPLDVVQQGTLRLSRGGFDFTQFNDSIDLYELKTLISVTDEGNVHFDGGTMDLERQWLPMTNGIRADGQSQVAVRGGLLTAWHGHTVVLADSSHLTISGGQIWNDDANAVLAQGDATITMTGGEITGGEGGAAIRLAERSRLTQTGGTLLSKEGSGIYMQDKAFGYVFAATINPSDGSAVGVGGEARAVVVGSMLISDSGLVSVAGSGSARLIDNVGHDDDFIAIRAADDGRIELIGNQIRTSDHVVMRISNRSVVDMQSGLIQSSDHDAIWIRDDATLNLRGGTIERIGGALGERRVDVLVRENAELHVYAHEPSLSDDRLRGSYRDGTAFDLKLSIEDESQVVLHDLAAIDFQRDGIIDAQDIDALGSTIRQAPANDLPDFDLDDSGSLEFADLETMLHGYLGIDFGDANLDGYFDSGDLVGVFGGGMYDQPRSAGWANGDWNQDGRFNSTDIVVAFQTGKYVQQRGRQAAGRAIPEPTSRRLAGIAALVFGVLFRRSQPTFPSPSLTLDLSHLPRLALGGAGVRLGERSGDDGLSGFGPFLLAHGKAIESSAIPLSPKPKRRTGRGPE